MAKLEQLGLYVQIACQWEATARKPGNVFPGADFADLRYIDLLASAAAIGGVLDKAWYRTIGEIVLEAVKATRRVAATNTNLGIILTLTPLASVMPGRDLRSELAKVLRSATIADSDLVYEAIREARPGGLGTAPQEDVSGTPTMPLRDVMALAADRDRIARLYARDFEDLFDVGVPTLMQVLTAGRSLETAIIAVFRRFLREFRDSLIERKHGAEIADEVRDHAARDDDSTLDAWLRSRRLNPGTSADLTAGCLFLALREGMIPLPFRGRWSDTP